MKPKGAFLPGHWPRLFFLAASLLTVVSIGLNVGHAVRCYVLSPVRDLQTASDPDWRYLIHGLDKVDCLGDTASWWTGTWCGEVPFWRPLTSYAFWGMRLVWPDEYLFPREIVLVSLHICFVGLAGLLLWRLTRRPWLVLLTVWLFAGQRLFSLWIGAPGNTQVGDVLSDPKNIPDPLAGIAMMLSLILLARGRWLGSLAMAVVSVCFKEIGFTTWPLAPIVLLWIHRKEMTGGWPAWVASRIRRNRLPVAMWVTALVLLAVVHCAAVGLGYRIGTNTYWYIRLVSYLCGPVAAGLTAGDRSAAVASVFLATAIAGLRRFSLIVRFLGILAALTLGMLADSWMVGTTWEISMARMVGPEMSLPNLVLYTAWLIIAWRARHDWRTVLFGLSMGFVAAAPTWLATQTLEHTRYVSSFYMEVVAASALVQAALAVRGRLPRRVVTG